MKLVTRHTDYAVRALLYMAQEPDRVYAVAELVDELKMPKAFLRGLLQELGKHGILGSRKGKGGGFVLTADPDDVTLYRLMEIFQGEMEITHCTFKKKMCEGRDVCPLRRRIKGIEATVFDELKKVTIASLLKDLER